MTINKIPSTSR